MSSTSASASVRVATSGQLLTVSYSDDQGTDPVGRVVRTQIYQSDREIRSPGRETIYHRSIVVMPTLASSFIGSNPESVTTAPYPVRTTAGDCHLISQSSRAVVCAADSIRQIRVVGSTGIDEIYIGSDGVSPWAYETRLNSEIAVDVDARSGDDRVYFDAARGNVVDGGPGDDLITSTRAFEGSHTIVTGLLGFTQVISMNDGAPRYLGGTGNDTLALRRSTAADGGEGNDQISGGPDRDLLSGGQGNDAIRAGEDDDVVSGNEGDDVINGSQGNDILDGNQGSDTVVDRSRGHNVVRGSDGRDRIDVRATRDGDIAYDEVDAGSGDDTIYARDRSFDSIQCGDGLDTYAFDVGFDMLVPGCEQYDENQSIFRPVTTEPGIYSGPSISLPGSDRSTSSQDKIATLPSQESQDSKSSPSNKIESSEKKESSSLSNK